jgi:hypothetical protein
MSTHDPDSVTCACGHMRGIHKAAAPNQCATNGCGCGRFRVRKPDAPASPEPPRVIQGHVERELPPAVRRPAPVTVARTELAICPPCEIDRCDTCLGEGCACACNDEPAAGPQDHQEETMTTTQHDQPPGSAAANFSVHLAARLRALGWTQAHLTDKSGLSAHVTGRALNGNGIELANAEKIAGLVGSSLPVMIGLYTCGTCTGQPPAGYACLECGTETRAA